ncbi:hypothetical protein OA90_14550 [Labrenzia sp. OB1]|nr:hypothetical protein OA90_14550 [Labrenzia sp. OB1]
MALTLDRHDVLRTGSAAEESTDLHSLKILFAFKRTHIVPGNEPGSTALPAGNQPSAGTPAPDAGKILNAIRRV